VRAVCSSSERTAGEKPAARRYISPRATLRVER